MQQLGLLGAALRASLPAPTPQVPSVLPPLDYHLPAACRASPVTPFHRSVLTCQRLTDPHVLGHLPSWGNPRIIRGPCPGAALTLGIDPLTPPLPESPPLEDHRGTKQMFLLSHIFRVLLIPF